MASKVRLTYAQSILHLVLSALILCSASWCTGQEKTPNSPKPSVADAKSSDFLRQYDQAVSALAERTIPAIVQINISGYGRPENPEGGESDNSTSDVIQRQRALGSGVIVDPDGYIMTNAHVVAGAQRIRVVLTPPMMTMAPNKTSFLLRQRVYDAKLIGSNRLVDLALVKIEEKNLPYIPLRPDFNVRLGEGVLTIGSPEGLEHTITRGIVSSVGRQVDPDRAMVYIQTDAPINPGNSGGALIDMDGNLLGLNTFILSQGGGSEGLGFAIPEPVVRFAYQEFRAYGHVRRSEILASAQAITADLATALHLSRDWGVMISDVIPGGPADQAGLKAKDIVLTVDGRVIDSYPKFAASIYLHNREKSLAINVLRNDSQMQINVTPIEAPKGVESLEDLIDPQNSLLNPLGVFLLELNAKLADSIGDLRSNSGLIVVARTDFTPRLDVDLHAGDVIRSLNGKPVTKIDELRSALAALPTATPVALEIERQGAYQFVAFEIE
jgi:serine protease Do